MTGKKIDVINVKEGMIETTDLSVKNFSMRFTKHVITFSEKGKTTKSLYDNVRKICSQNCHHCSFPKAFVKVQR